jgi:DNA-binding transcriptional LysR family regulator
MRIEHLEVFYYVVRAGGFSKAVYLIPSKVTQSTISEHVIMFEAQTGVILIVRHPGGRRFELTPAGQDLYMRIKPFFDMLHDWRTTRRTKAGHRLRVGASNYIVQEYLQTLLLILEKAFPDVDITLHTGTRDDLEARLRADALDVCIAAVEQPFADLSHHPLLTLEPVLLVPESLPFRTAEEVLKNRGQMERLICPPADEALTRCALRELENRGVPPPRVSYAPDIASVPVMVAGRQRCGVCLSLPKFVHYPGIRALPLPIPRLNLVAHWSAKNSPALEAYLELLKLEAVKVASVLGAVKPAVPGERRGESNKLRAKSRHPRAKS